MELLGFPGHPPGFPNFPVQASHPSCFSRLVQKEWLFNEVKGAMAKTHKRGQLSYWGLSRSYNIIGNRFWGITSMEKMLKFWSHIKKKYWGYFFDSVFSCTQVLLKSLPRPFSTPSISLSFALLYAANSLHESEKKISEHAAVSPFFKMKLDIFKSDGGKLYVLLYYVQLPKQTFIFLY